jgi:heme exporter protein A
LYSTAKITLERWAAMRLTGEHIGCVRGGRDVLRDLSFSVSAGELMAVTGRNGAGKTTLLRLVAGLLPPSAGTLRLEPQGDITIAEEAHYLGHRDGLKAALTVAENLKFWIDFLGGKGAAPPALSRVGLAALADFPAAYLSAGQRRRLALARLVAVPRRLWLLDEPATALDAAGQAMLTALIAEHLARGGLAMVATHGALGLSPTAELALGAWATS